METKPLYYSVLCCWNDLVILSRGCAGPREPEPRLGLWKKGKLQGALLAPLTPDTHTGRARQEERLRTCQHLGCGLLASRNRENYVPTYD